MAVVVYQCNVCKRQIELQRNTEGLETINGCTITNGCRGKLYQIEVLEDFVRGRLPPEVVGLENWQQRKVLHNHLQSIERLEWIVIHNLGTFPSIQVFVDRPIESDPSNREEILPNDVVIIDKNSLKLIFDRPWSGVAQLVARASDPQLLQPTQAITEAPVLPFQLSSSGEITIATRINSPFPGEPGEPSSLNLQVQYTTPQETQPLITYAADDQPTLNSAWRDFDKVVIKGKIFTVRSFSGLVPEMTSGDIPSGSTFIFSGIDRESDLTFRPIEQNEVYLLLATSPFEIVDKITDQVIDVTSVSSTENTFDLFLSTGEFFSSRDVAQTIYPLVRETN